MMTHAHTRCPHTDTPIFDRHVGGGKWDTLTVMSWGLAIVGLNANRYWWGPSWCTELGTFTPSTDIITTNLPIPAWLTSTTTKQMGIVNHDKKV